MKSVANNSERRVEPVDMPRFSRATKVPQVPLWKAEAEQYRNAVRAPFLPPSARRAARPAGRPPPPGPREPARAGHPRGQNPRALRPEGHPLTILPYPMNPQQSFQW